MKRKLKFLAFVLCTTVVVGLSVSACSSGKDGKSAYDIWLEQGNTGTEQDFLDSLKGDQGLQGNPGRTPEIKVGVNGNWYVDGKDTGVKAQGDNGFPGNKIYNGQGEPAVENAVEGDMYIDTDKLDIYFYEDGEWVLKANIKGEIVKPFELSCIADGNSDMPIDLEAGVYVIEADLGSAELTTGKLQAKVESNTTETSSLLVKSQTRTEAAGSGHNIYYGYIVIGETDTHITFSAIGEAVTAGITLSAYEQPTLEADGKPVEIPVNSGMVTQFADTVLDVAVGSSVMAGDYTLTMAKEPLSRAESVSIFDDLLDIHDLNLKIGQIRIATGSATLTIGEPVPNSLIFRSTTSNNATFNFLVPATITLTKNV